MRQHQLYLIAIVALVFCCGQCGAVAISDSMTTATETGGIGGSHPDQIGQSATWTSYWLDNNTAGHNTLTSPSASYPSSDNGGTVATPLRTATGTSFTVTGPIVDNGAFISLSPASSTLLVAKATVHFTSTSPAWAAIGLEPNISVNGNPPDFYNSQSGLQMLVYPQFDGDYSEFYIDTVPASPGPNGTPFGTLNAQLNSIPAADNGVWGLTHTMMLTLDRSSGAVASYVDGSLVGSGVLNSTDISRFSNPTNLGMFITVRGQRGGVTTASNPATAIFSDVSVVPEPGAVCLLAAGVSVFASRRRV